MGPCAPKCYARLNGEIPQVNMYMEKLILASIWYYTQRAVMIMRTMLCIWLHEEIYMSWHRWWHKYHEPLQFCHIPRLI